MNKSFFTGRLTRDPELKHTQSGTAVLSASIAVDDGWGEHKKTFFPDLVFWRNNAEYLSRFARKGDLIEVVARYSERKYRDREGQERTAREFQAEDVKILSSRRSDGQEAAQGSCGAAGTHGDYGTNAAAQGGYGTQMDDEDEGELPF